MLPRTSTSGSDDAIPNDSQDTACPLHQAERFGIVSAWQWPTHWRRKPNITPHPMPSGRHVYSRGSSTWLIVVVAALKIGRYSTGRLATLIVPGLWSSTCGCEWTGSHGTHWYSRTRAVRVAASSNLSLTVHGLTAPAPKNSGGRNGCDSTSYTMRGSPASSRALWHALRDRSTSA